MRKLFYVFFGFFALLFVACIKPEEEVEPAVYPQTLTFSVQNNRDCAVTVKIELVEWSNYWCKFDYVNSRGTQEKQVQPGKTEEFSFTDYLVPEYSFPFKQSFVFSIDEDLYLGFPKTEEPDDAFALDIEKTKEDGLHWICISGDETQPTTGGSISVPELVGIEDGKLYTSVTEHFSVTIDAGDVSFSLDSVEF